MIVEQPLQRSAQKIERVIMVKSREETPREGSPFLSANEAANYLRLSARALENFRATGEGPSYRKHGGRVVYHRQDLDRWSAGRRFRGSGNRDSE